MMKQTNMQRNTVPSNELTQKYMEEMMQLYRERSLPGTAQPVRQPVEREPYVSSTLPFNNDDYGETMENAEASVSESDNSCPGDSPCGTLQVEVTTASGDIPIQNAHITVYSSDGSTVYRFMISDASGVSPVVTLPAPPRALSETPDESAKPYSEYNVRVTAMGYYPVTNVNVPIFSTIKSIQSVHMIPLAEFTTPPYPDITYAEKEPSALLNNSRE